MKDQTKRKAARITGYIFLILGILIAAVGAMVVFAVNASILALIPLIIPILVGALLIRWGNKKIVQQEKQTEKFDKYWEQ